MKARNAVGLMVLALALLPLPIVACSRPAAPEPATPASGATEGTQHASARPAPSGAASLEVVGEEKGPKAFASGGVPLTGVGEGGGGRGQGVGLGDLGPLGRTASSGRLGGAHSTASPTLRQGRTEVSGRLPPEVIQRVVRMSFGRFRLCYEEGLRTNPNLAGTVTVRYTINERGESSPARDGGSTLPDPAVVQCVVRAFEGIDYPKPESGTVAVTYPLLFTPGDPTPPNPASSPPSSAP